MNDIIQSIKAFLYDRVSSPLSGALITAWCILNYRVIITIFSSEPVERKFIIIEKHYDALNHTNPWPSIVINGEYIYGLVFPAILASIYIYIYPWFAEKVYGYSLEKQIALAKIKQKVNNKRLLSEEESQWYFKRLIELEDKYEKDIGIYRKQISNINKDEFSTLDIKSPLKERNEKDEAFDDTPFIGADINRPTSIDELLNGKETLPKEQEKILILFIGGGSVSASDISIKMNISIDRTWVLLERLTKAEFITSENNNNIYWLTRDGREYLFDKGYLDE